MRNFALFAAILFLCQCKKEPEVPYPNENIVMDNAQAALYFHTIFREVENSWAFIANADYEVGVYTDEASKLTNYKTLTYDEQNLKIEYNSWETNKLYLSGDLIVRFETASYRRDGKIANINIIDFSINGQRVVGTASIKFVKTVEEKDQYTFTLLDGAAIHKHGHAQPVLISSAINNGQYERIEGNESLTQEDDVWVYSGVTTGLLHDDPNLKYTNTVSPSSSYLENGESIDGKIHYSMKCAFAQQGLSQITFAKRPAIAFIYDCSGYQFLSVAHID